MGCSSCAESKRINALIKKNKAETENVAPQILEARFQICLACPHHKRGQCNLLHAYELSDYARKNGAICPHPDRKW